MATGFEHVDWVRASALLSAGICMGIGALGPAIGQGFIGGKACEAIGNKPEGAGVIMRAMLSACVFAETSSVYCLLIAMLLLFFVK